MQYCLPFLNEKQCSKDNESYLCPSLSLRIIVKSTCAKRNVYFPRLIYREVPSAQLSVTFGDQKFFSS